MTEKYLVINSGSSSLKFSLYEMPELKEIVSGVVEKIGSEESFYTIKYTGKKVQIKKSILNHSDAIKVMLNELLNNKFISNIDEIKGVGHRIVHGADKYKDSVLITDEVVEDIKNFSKFAPLHHKGHLAGIESMMKYLNDVPQVAVFDTSFHQTMPKEKYMYATPYSWYLENGVRKYGFHGTSHKYITETAKNILQKEDVNLIICHLGNGTSISAIKNGKCINTTMGMTPLDGTIMGTRSGSIDPSIIEYIVKEKNLTLDQVIKLLNSESGLKGICGESDFRDIEELANDKDENALLAIKMFRDSVVKYIAQYYFELNGNVDALIFTAGIGENVSFIREDIVNAISNPMGIKLNKEFNDNVASFKNYQTGLISTNDSKTKVLVIPTNEEYMILKDTYNITKNIENNKDVKKCLR